MSGRPRPYTLEDLQENFKLGGKDGETVIRKTGRNADKPASFYTDHQGYRLTRTTIGFYKSVNVREHIIKVALSAGILPDVVDHIDNNPSNNRLSNLRACSRSENMCNQKHRKKASNLPRGVVRVGDKYRAYARYLGKQHWAGTFSSLEGARAAAVAIRNKLHGEFARHD